MTGTQNLAQGCDAAGEQQTPRWYAVQTCSRHEKRVAKSFDERCIQGFLPLYAAVHRWKDRRMRVELPLFPGYVFVRTTAAQRRMVVTVAGVVGFVCFGGQPVPVPENEIENLRTGLSNGMQAEPHPYLRAGHRVRIKAGPFLGREGILIRKSNDFRVVLSMEAIARSIALEVNLEDVAAI